MSHQGGVDTQGCTAPPERQKNSQKEVKRCCETSLEELVKEIEKWVKRRRKKSGDEVRKRSDECHY